jgi:hypothetical protein
MKLAIRDETLIISPGTDWEEDYLKSLFGPFGKTGGVTLDSPLYRRDVKWDSKRLIIRIAKE